MAEIEPQFKFESNHSLLMLSQNATMVELGERLDAAMKARSVSISQLSTAVKMSYQGIRKIVRGETKDMEAANCKKIADYLKINSAWLAAGEGEMDLPKALDAPAEPLPEGAIPTDPTKPHRIWVVGKGAGGLPERIWTDGDHPVGVTDQYGLVASQDPQAFLVEVSEESMIPVYTPGNFALVEPGTEPEVEDDVLVRLSSGQTMIKRLLSQRGAYRFGSYNSTAVLHFRFEDVDWVYYIAHPVPRRKIKSHW
ncbi:phage repressor protein C with HTH and peptisase S24 domain [Variovorax boronicumulans]|nr:phage repressor protein C with HTH and peptisase S24 domain [Variovorax boronicumulans]